MVRDANILRGAAISSRGPPHHSLCHLSDKNALPWFPQSLLYARAGTDILPKLVTASLVGVVVVTPLTSLFLSRQSHSKEVSSVLSSCANPILKKEVGRLHVGPRLTLTHLFPCFIGGPAKNEGRERIGSTHAQHMHKQVYSCVRAGAPEAVLLLPRACIASFLRAVPRVAAW